MVWWLIGDLASDLVGTVAGLIFWAVVIGIALIGLGYDPIQLVQSAITDLIGDAINPLN